MSKTLPNRTYRDSAEVAIALGELKSGKGFRNTKQAEAAEQPGSKGGKAAVKSFSLYSVSGRQYQQLPLLNHYLA
jgi:hypothetical protein